MNDVIDLQGLQQAVEGIGKQISTAINIEKEQQRAMAAEASLQTALDEKEPVISVLPITKGGTGQSTEDNIRTLVNGISHKLILNTTSVCVSNISSTTTTYSVYVGLNSGRGVSSGSMNTAVGSETLSSTATSAISGCTAIGRAVMNYVSNCTNCTAIGNTAMAGNALVYQNSSNLTAVGYGAMWGDRQLRSFTNSTALGAGAQVTSSNQVVLGDDKTNTYIKGGSVQITSDIRDKADVTELTYDHQMFIKKLRPVNYRWDVREAYNSPPTIDENGNIAGGQFRPLSEIVHDGTHKGNRLHNGFIAQEVKEIMDEMDFDFAGYQDHKVNGGDDVLTLGYEEFIAPMVACIQDLFKEVEQLRQEIKELKSK